MKLSFVWSLVCTEAVRQPGNRSLRERSARIYKAFGVGDFRVFFWLKRTLWIDDLRITIWYVNIIESLWIMISTMPERYTCAILIQGSVGLGVIQKSLSFDCTNIFIDMHSACKWCGSYCRLSWCVGSQNTVGTGSHACIMDQTNPVPAHRPEFTINVKHPNKY